ncbi:MAG: glutathione transferase GstA [Pseudomonadales bacterium]|nr:glutathione transferase GstA [Pseudomonadales bacterium]
MKLFYTPGACSMAIHIALNEAGVKYELEKVDLQSKKTESGLDYLVINPKGYVPCLQLDNGEYLTEVSALLQYIADSNPSKNLLPPVGDLARYRVLETANFVSTELHKNFGPLFNPALDNAARKERLELIGKRLDIVNSQLEGREYLVGDQFTIADAYLTTVLGWATFAKLDLAAWPNLGAYAGRTMSRPGVVATLKAEGMM